VPDRKSYIVDLPPQPGIRDQARGRRPRARARRRCAAFDDLIGVNGWPMEPHVAAT
jgi:hypothetical protein